MHKDLVIEQDHRGKKVKIVEDPKLVEPGYLDPKLKWAKSRMHWWLSKKEESDDKVNTVTNWEQLYMSIKASPYAEYTHEQILYYSDDIEGNGEPLLDTDGDTLQDHIYEFCEVKVILGTRTTWKRVKMNGGEEKYEVWLGTKVTLPKTGPFTAQWTISHAVVSSEPKRGQHRNITWSQRGDAEVFFDPDFDPMS